jgi:tetratricopeptide (TPR) repeat protein
LAEKYLLRSIEIASNIGALSLEKIEQRNISDVYLMQKNYKKALEHYKKFVTIKDSLFSAEKSKELTRHEMNYEFEKKEASSKAEQDKRDAVNKAEGRKQKAILALVCCVLALVFIFAGFIFRSLRITRKQKALIEIKSKETEAQRDIIEERNKEILDSIHYAKRIQVALMPTEKYIERVLERSNKSK